MNYSSCLYEVVTVSEAATLLGVSRRWIRKLCEEDKLVARETMGGWLITTQSVNKHKEGMVKRNER